MHYPCSSPIKSSAKTLSGEFGNHHSLAEKSWQASGDSYIHATACKTWWNPGNVFPPRFAQTINDGFQSLCHFSDVVLKRHLRVQTYVLLLSLTNRNCFFIAVLWNYATTESVNRVNRIYWCFIVLLGCATCASLTVLFFVTFPFEMEGHAISCACAIITNETALVYPVGTLWRLIPDHLYIMNT